MTNINLLWDNAKNYMFKKFSSKPEKMITIAFALACASASIAQALAVTFNKKIPNEQKKFLVPQELTDGTINVLATLFITGAMGRYAVKCVETGKISTPKIRKMLGQLPESAKFTMGATETNLDDIVCGHGNSQFRKEFYKAYYDFRAGMSMISTTVGGFLSGSLVAPIVRNEVASYHQKQQSAKKEIQKPMQSYSNNRTYSPYASNRSLLKI